MSLRAVAGLLGLMSVLFATSAAQAQCTKDTDCGGESVCEAGSCVAAAQAAPGPVAAEPRPEAAAPAAVAPVVAAPEPAPLPPDDPPPRRRYSTGMMVGGIVMVSLVPVALIAAAVADSRQKACERGPSQFEIFDDGVDDYTNCDRYDNTIYGGLIVGITLTAAGIPLIVIGAKKEPVTARITPWATARSAGLGLRLEL